MLPSAAGRTPGRSRRPDRFGWRALIAVLALGCARAVVPAGSSTAPPVAAPIGPLVGVPSVIEVTPTPIVVREGQPTLITIRGAGFDASSNTVTVGPVTVTAVAASRGGTVIEVSLPDRVPSGGGAAPMLWEPGRYSLTVATARGTSMPVMVAIQEPR
jgi:hypothetical protein